MCCNSCNCRPGSRGPWRHPLLIEEMECRKRGQLNRPAPPVFISIVYPASQTFVSSLHHQYQFQNCALAPPRSCKKTGFQQTVIVCSQCHARHFGYTRTGKRAFPQQVWSVLKAAYTNPRCPANSVGVDWADRCRAEGTGRSYTRC